MEQRVVRMMNPRRKHQSVYFYDGSVKADANGVVAIPAVKKHWMQRAWILGFRLNGDGVRCCLNLHKHIAHELANEPAETTPCCIAECCDAPCCDEAGVATDADCACAGSATPADEAETAESGEETAEDAATDAGRQPAGDDRIRSGADEGAVSIPEGELDSGDSDGSPVRGEAD